MSGHQDRGPLVQAGDRNVHRLSGVAGSIPGIQMLLQGEEEHQCLANDGQHLSGCLHQQDGRDGVPGSKQNKKGVLTVVSGEGHLCLSPASSGQTEQHTSCRIQNNEGQTQLDAVATDIPFYQQEVWPSGSGSIHIEALGSIANFVSWRPDPEAMAIDAFTLRWTGLNAYSNPPWSLVGRVLAQVHQQRADLVLVAPVWKTQPWFLRILDMCVNYPRIIPERHDLIVPTYPLSMPQIIPQLAVWNISGNDTQSNSFQMKLQNSCSHLGGRNPQDHTIDIARSGLASVVQGVPIPFLAL